MEKAGRINVYTCEKCGHRHVTVNAVDGVTPFMIKCRDPLGCHEEFCYSAIYRCDQSQIPQWEWYRPEGDEMASLDAATRDHVSRGGLLLRRLDAAGREKYGFRSRRG